MKRRIFAQQTSFGFGLVYPGYITKNKEICLKMLKNYRLKIIVYLLEHVESRRNARDLFEQPMGKIHDRNINRQVFCPSHYQAH